MRLEREEFARQWSCPAREAQIDADLSRFKQAGIERQQVGWTVRGLSLRPPVHPRALAIPPHWCAWSIAHQSAIH